MVHQRDTDIDMDGHMDTHTHRGNTAWDECKTTCLRQCLSNTEPDNLLHYAGSPGLGRELVLNRSIMSMRSFTPQRLDHDISGQEGTGLNWMGCAQQAAFRPLQLPALPGTTRVFRPPWDGRERRQELVRGVAAWRAFASAGSRGHSPGPLGPQARERESSVRLRSPRKQESRKLYLLQLRILGEALFIFLVDRLPVFKFRVTRR